MAKHLATITLIGHDKAGVIARITQLLFQLGANIEAMEEQVTRGLFSMTLQASWTPARFDGAAIQQRVREAARDLSMEANIHFAPLGPQRLAILVTREPHVFEGLLAKSSAALGARPVVVISNRPDLEPLARARKLPFYHVPFLNRAKAEEQVLKLLEKHAVDFIVLARFMKILSPNFVWRWKNKIINIHPSLLPAFPGANAYRQAYERAGSAAPAEQRDAAQHREARADARNALRPARRPRLCDQAPGRPLGPGLLVGRLPSTRG
jgi:formyltetrahydrofolate deformylase